MAASPVPLLIYKEINVLGTLLATCVRRWRTLKLQSIHTRAFFYCASWIAVTKMKTWADWVHAVNRGGLYQMSKATVMLLHESVQQGGKAKGHHQPQGQSEGECAAGWECTISLVHADNQYEEDKAKVLLIMIVDLNCMRFLLHQIFHGNVQTSNKKVNPWPEIQSIKVTLPTKATDSTQAKHTHTTLTHVNTHLY